MKKTTSIYQIAINACAYKCKKLNVQQGTKNSHSRRCSMGFIAHEFYELIEKGAPDEWAYNHISHLTHSKDFNNDEAGEILQIALLSICENLEQSEDIQFITAVRAVDKYLQSLKREKERTFKNYNALVKYHEKRLHNAIVRNCLPTNPTNTDADMQELINSIFDNVPLSRVEKVVFLEFLRYSKEDTADMLNISVSTVSRERRQAKATNTTIDSFIYLIESYLG